MLYSKVFYCPTVSLVSNTTHMTAFIDMKIKPGLNRADDNITVGAVINGDWRNMIQHKYTAILQQKIYNI